MRQQWPTIWKEIQTNWSLRLHEKERNAIKTDVPNTWAWLSSKITFNWWLKFEYFQQNVCFAKRVLITPWLDGKGLNFRQAERLGGHSQVTRGNKAGPKKWGRRFRPHWTYSALAEAASDLSKQNIAKAAVTFDVQIYHTIPNFKNKSLLWFDILK